ncbi:Hypothetical protein PHPALM_13495 [Phytophthora palmivora]|uniref:M96 mating-specific protein family n=1 Tax=Phytophthora palmivora TaxID=4796 RepID=A0A2P4XXD3_9STRA|nr:Hypothetical protein PHPALM_13495 [Phytophthora palmivora]
MEDNDNHDSDDWMEDEVSEQSKAHQDNLEELFVDGSRRPSTTMSSTNTARGSYQNVVSPSNALNTAVDVNAATKTPRRHRVSRKEELEYLRKKVVDMEDKLQQLKDHAESGGSPSPPAPALEDEKAAMKLEQSIALWKKMAERQKSQREMVESENTKLREKLKTQVRMAKSLQRILRKRERAAEQVCVQPRCGIVRVLITPLFGQMTAETPKRFKQLVQDDHTVATGGEFDVLVHNLDALYALTYERLAVCPVASGSQPVIRHQDVKYNDFTGMFLEFVHSKLFPFDLNAVCRATWRHMSEPGVKFNAYFEESAEARENTVLRRFGVEIKQDERTAKMAGRQAIRRYIESDCIVIVRNSLIDRVELSGATTQGITFQDVGWVVLKDVTGQVSAAGPMTLMQSYSSLTPDVDLDSRWEIGTLTDFVLQSREEMEVGNESIVENMLLEEAAKQKSSK